MSTIKYSYTIYIVVLCTALTLLLVSFGNQIFENGISIKGTGAAIALFSFLEIITNWFIEIKNKTLNPRQSVNFFLGIKVGKILLTLMFAAIYAITVKVEQKRFFVVFLILYLVYLLADTIYLTRREKRLKATINN